VRSRSDSQMLNSYSGFERGTVSFSAVMIFDTFSAGDIESAIKIGNGIEWEVNDDLEMFH
jgi:hypothetical protein